MSDGQNRDLYDVLMVLRASSEFPTLGDEDRVAVDHAFCDFTLSDVALDPDRPPHAPRAR